MAKKKIIKGYKAFDKNMKCQGFQYKEGKIYKHKGEVKCCPNSNDLKNGRGGFHFCTNPMDIWSYYPVDSEYHEVEALGKNDIHDEDSKISTTEIKIGVKLGLGGFVKAAVDYLVKLCCDVKVTKSTKNKNDNGKHSAKIGSSGDSAQIGSSGDYAKIGSSGDYAKIGSSGDSARIGSSGDYAKIGSSGDSAQIGSSGDSARIDMTGKYSVGMNAAHGSMIKGKIGSWITLAEWKYDDKNDKYIPICVKTAKITGNKIKADTWYKLENKKFVEVK